jgi:hypothetical protein
MISQSPQLQRTLVHLTANAAILGLGYYWLTIGESRTSALIGSIAIALIWLILTAWTYGASLSGYRQALRNVLPLIAAGLALVLVYALLARWETYSAKPAFRIASWLTLTLRKPIKPATVASVFGFVLWIVRWAILPVCFLPVVTAIAQRGWRGFRSRTRQPWLSWIEVPVLLWLAFKAPLILIYWVPRLNGFVLQTASFTLRALLAYLLFNGAWLVLGRTPGRPRETQPSTAVSP